MPPSSITSVKALNPRHLCSVLPGAPGYLAIAWSQVPKKWLRSGHFLASQTGSGRRRKSSAPVVSDGSSAYEESDTYRGNCRVWTRQHGARYRRVPTTPESEVSVRGSYFGVRVGAEQSHEVIEVVAASWRRTRICNCLRPIYLKLIDPAVAAQTDTPL